MIQPWVLSAFCGKTVEANKATILDCPHWGVLTVAQGTVTAVSIHIVNVSNAYFLIFLDKKVNKK